MIPSPPTEGQGPIGLLSEAEARARILARIAPLPPISLPLLAAIGRFSVGELRGTVPLPGFDNSAMDGYAVALPPGAASLPAGTSLQITGEQPAGVARGLRVESGQAIRIFTGAPIPHGTGAIVMQEDVERSGDGIRLLEAVKPGEFIRRAGGDLARGQLLFGPGSRLTAQRLSLLASQGLPQVMVGGVPRVAILATGDELRAAGESLGPGEIYESNSVLLAALAASLGAQVTVLERARDDCDDLDGKLAEALGQHDVLVVAGGVSVGERDLVKARLAAAGVGLHLWRVHIQPGKPFLYGRKPAGELVGRGTHVFGLPGNPVSSFVTFLLFVRPALLRLMGAADAELTLPAVPAVAGENLVHRGDRPHYLRGTMDEAGRFFTRGKQESHALAALSHSRVLVRMEPRSTVPAGGMVRAYLL